jgi:hypothetical protein
MPAQGGLDLFVIDLPPTRSLLKEPILNQNFRYNILSKTIPLHLAAP